MKTQGTFSLPTMLLSDCKKTVAISECHFYSRVQPIYALWGLGQDSLVAEHGDQSKCCFLWHHGPAGK